jgi:prepilin-type N-terminal cleavage/methylation domain-containing protein
VKQDNQKTLIGFTLIELLVVMFIISLLAGSAFVVYSNGQRRYEVSVNLQQLVADLRLVQSMALSGKKTGAVTPMGYGLYISTGQYLLFYNSDTRTSYVAGSSVIIETVSLPAGVSLSPGGSSIYFVPPDPTTYLNDATTGSLVLTLENGATSREVIVNSSGLIDFE